MGGGISRDGEGIRWINRNGWKSCRGFDLRWRKRGRLRGKMLRIRRKLWGDLREIKVVCPTITKKSKSNTLNSESKTLTLGTPFHRHVEILMVVFTIPRRSPG